MARSSDLFFTKQKLFQCGFAVTELVERNQNSFFKSLKNIEQSWTRRLGRYCVFTPERFLKFIRINRQFFSTFRTLSEKRSLWKFCLVSIKSHAID